MLTAEALTSYGWISARPARRAAWSEAEDKILRDTVLARRAAGEPVDWASFPKILPGTSRALKHGFLRAVAHDLSLSFS